MKPRIRVPMGKRTNVFYFTDTHFHPGDDPSRIKWIARHIGENLHRFHMIRHGGDLCDFDSVSSHDPIGSVKAKAKPSLMQDLEAFEEAFAVFNKELGPSHIPAHFDEGNHERRVYNYEQLRGELDGSLHFRMKEIAAQYRWTYHEYGELNFVDGVAFTHIPQSAGRFPYSSPQIITRDLTYDLVCGHTHKGGEFPVAKIGGGVRYLNGGCSLPHGYVKPYAKLNPTNWWYGAMEIEIIDGRIAGYTRIPMSKLKELYA